ncbi:STAS domain-containing protein [Solirubrobacter phytolaccae]|uniref:Anti-sigma factor antagonist n=1 Tax=Solirubrobacter phytolaccae TaxID=1404360 RepID=A0A9X3SEM2_9ACTN|nr:STAS domain-containing protein [Solirubrobacter phytolaccae]MDA0185060.1 STAS domain-containing protein [Solirubrobacter phytolaccae]
MPDEFAPKPFHCAVDAREDGTFARPVGDLDMSTAPDVEAVLRAAVDGGAKRVVVDLRGLHFMDSTGLTLLTRWNNASRRDGFEFALVGGDDRIQRLFVLTGLHEYFTFTAG